MNQREAKKAFKKVGVQVWKRTRNVRHCTLSAVTEDVEDITIDDTYMDAASCSSDDELTQLKVYMDQMGIEMEKKDTEMNEQDALIVKLKIQLAYQLAAVSMGEPKPSVIHTSET